MRAIVRGVALPFFCLTVATLGWPGMIQAQESIEQIQDDVEVRIIEALERGNERVLKRLVEENQYVVFSLINELLDATVEEEVGGDVESVSEKYGQAEQLAILYRETFGVGYLAERVQLYRQWSEEEKRNKGIADTTLQHGISLFERSEYQPAAATCSTAVEMYLGLEDTLGAARSFYRLGDACSYLGSYGKAMEHYETAGSFFRKTGDKKGEGRNLYGIGWVYCSIGKDEVALDYYARALEILRAVGDRQGEGRAIIRTGVSYWSLEQPEKASDYLEQALQIFHDIGDTLWEAKVLMNLGVIQEKLGNLQGALDYFQRSIELARITGYQRGRCINLQNLGEVYEKLDQWDRALECYQEGLRIAQQINDSERIWEHQKCLGYLYEQNDLPDQALEHYLAGLRTAESMWQRLGIESLRTHSSFWRSPVYFHVVQMFIEKGDDARAFEYTERRKARALLDILGGGGLALREPLSPELKSERDKVLRDLTAVNVRLAEEYSKREPQRDGEWIPVLQDSLAKLRREHQDIAQRIELEHPDYADLTGISRPLSLEEVQQRILRHGPVLIDYFVGKDSTIVWVVSDTSVHCQYVSIGRTELDSLVTELRRPFEEVKTGKITNRRDIYYDLSIANELYRRIFRPVEQHLREGDNLIIVPDDILYYLPFEALVTGIEEREPDQGILYSQFEGAQYLVERFSLSYAPSASVLSPQFRKLRDEVERDGRLLAFGSPDFGGSGGFEIEEEDEPSGLLAFLIKDGKGWSFKPLTESEEEVKRISEIVEPSKVFVGSEAKEEYFKEQAGNYDILHISTHAILEERQPLYSRIVFAQDDDPTEDGFLQTFEIFELDLNADLVVLSACETGLGELSRGEGLIGLTRAFMYAGVPSLMVSLWSVDESTCRLMSDFYENLNQGLPKAEALRRAKIKLIRTREGGLSYAHPFLWAPFVLVGEWR